MMILNMIEKETENVEKRESDMTMTEIIEGKGDMKWRKIMRGREGEIIK